MANAGQRASSSGEMAGKLVTAGAWSTSSQGHSTHPSIACDTSWGIVSYVTDKLTKLLTEMGRNPNNVRFADLLFVCRHFFGVPRSQGTSHYVFKMPWSGDPRVNIQDKGGKAKPYQVKQVLTAIKKLEERS